MFCGEMKVISVIEDGEVINKILKHLGLWEVKARLLPKATAPQKIREYSIDYFVFQLPASENLSGAPSTVRLVDELKANCSGPNGSSSNEWLYVDPGYPGACPP